ncbi:MAG: CRISPR-associated helicase Cas3' [Clostridiales bacterium]|nr:CRISPR-associated helicase Cas3' [Clostridiales bacterium]
MERKLERFPSETGIQKARRQISDQCRLFAEQPGGIYRLNVPTGAGKTLSSLRYALAHAAQWNKSRIIFTAPLLTILEQNAQVIRDYVGDDSMILEHHSNLVRTQEEPEQLDLQELLAEDWSAPIIITTLVQLLNTLFSGKTTSIRRFQSLADSVIILDEVQTVPTKMLTLFNLAVNFLTEICGATVVLCSATQPCLEKAAHPLASVPKDIVPYDRELWSAFCRTQIRNAGNLRLEDLPAFALETLEKANSLLIVCNKKDQAAYLYQKLSGCGFRCCHLSAAMCTAHRRAALAGLQAALAAGEKTVCVSTQVIEAGVDISFERVIRLSAGMDSVVQAAGRCNRNGEQTGPAPVCLVQCQNENLARLPDIQRGKDATGELLAQYRQRPERFRNDLSSDEAIGYYYRRLYQEMPEGFQDYRIQDKHYTIFSLLADNTYFSDDRAEAHGTYFLNQAFQLAGKLFQVYDEDSIDVIVPYGEGRTVIADLGSDRAGRDLAYRKSCLDRAKPYTVSLYQYQRQQLERDHGLLPIRDGDDSVRVLAEWFYDEKTGLSLSGTAAQFWEV